MWNDLIIYFGHLEELVQEWTAQPFQKKKKSILMSSVMPPTWLGYLDMQSIPCNKCNQWNEERTASFHGKGGRYL